MELIKLNPENERKLPQEIKLVREYLKQEKRTEVKNNDAEQIICEFY